MSKRVLDEQGRWRSKIISFRMSNEENISLDKLVSLSGMNKQEYLINRVLQQDVIVNPSPYLLKCLTKQLQCFISLLKEKDINELDQDDKQIMIYMLKVIVNLKEGSSSDA